MQLETTLSVLDLGEHLLGFYDGRIAGVRYHASEPNWLDDGGFALGICSYAVVDGQAAVVYDTHLSMAHARDIRKILEARGVRDIRVVLSHWHLDHVAGNAVFDDCEIIACAETARLLAENKAAIEAGAHDGPPAISPLVLPTSIFEDGLDLACGNIGIELRPLDIHSSDGVAMYLPSDGTLLAGDTLEDTVTYVVEPDRLAIHLRDLDRMTAWDVSRILPNHGAKERISGAGYDHGLIGATRIYIERLLRVPADERLASLPLPHFIPEALAEGAVTLFEPYEAVHRGNVAKVQALSHGATG
ncbi:MAG TPA: MBL fold metallo-hydrolase [Hyphomicrobium sp.]|nr:MBL fold metallo-hydrolase [Hyphomicrobium sp.]